MKLILENWQSFVNETEDKQIQQPLPLQNKNQQQQPAGDIKASVEKATAVFMQLIKQGKINLSNGDGIEGFYAKLRKDNPEQGEAIAKGAYDSLMKKVEPLKGDFKNFMDLIELFSNEEKMSKAKPKAKANFRKQLADLIKTENLLIQNLMAYNKEDPNLKKALAQLKGEKEPAKTDPAVKKISDKYGEQIKNILPDTAEQNAIVKFLVFLSTKKLLKESATPYIKAGVFTKEIFEEYMRSLATEDKKSFFAALKKDTVMEFLKKALTGPDSAKPEEPAAETEGGDDEEIVDPDPEKLKALRISFGKFKNQFYKEKKLQEQAVLVTALLKALKAFSDEESAEAYGRRADRDRSTKSPAEPTTDTPAKRDDLYEVEDPAAKETEGADKIAAKPNDIRNFKTSVRAFQRALKLSEQLVIQAMKDTKGGKLVSDASRAKVVKFATATQEKIKMLNDSINKIMGPVERGSLQEKLSPDIEAKMQKYRETLDRIEDVYEIIVGTDIEKGGLGRIIDNLSKSPPVKMNFNEIERGVKKALELLSTIKKFFPSIVPFEGSKLQATDITDQYKEAIAKLDLDSSDIQTLKDVLEGDQGKVAILSFQDRIIEFSKDIERIFGIPGLTEKDSADPDAEREDDKEDEEAEEEEATDFYKEGAEAAKRKYATDEFIMSLETEAQKTAFYYLISFFMKEGLITENIADKIKTKLGAAIVVIREINPNYAVLINKVLGDKKKADAFVDFLQRVDAKGMEATKTPFNTAISVSKFITMKLLKNTTISARIEDIGIKSGSQDENNLLRLLAYLLASDAEFIPALKKESISTMMNVSEPLAGDKRRAVLTLIMKKDKELFKWAMKWMKDNKVKVVKLFNAIEVFIEKKNYKFNTKGLKLAMLLNLNFKDPTLEIPEEEADVVKQTIEKIKDAPTFDMDNYDGYEELKTAIATKVIDVVQDEGNEEVFSWSSGQPDSVLEPIVQDLLASSGGLTLDTEKDPFEDSKFRKKYSKLPEFDSWKQMSKDQKTAVLNAIEKYDDEESEDKEPSRGVFDVTESRLRRAIKKYIVEAILKSNWEEMAGDLKSNDLFKGKKGINLISSFLRDFQDNYGDEIKDDPKGDDKKKNDEKKPETTKEDFKEVFQGLESVFEREYKQKYSDGKHFLNPDEFPQIEDNLVEKKANIITDMILKSKYPNIAIEIQIGRGGRSEQSIMYKLPQPLNIENSVPDFMGKMDKAIIEPEEKKDDEETEEPKSPESDGKWKTFFDDNKNIKFYKSINRLYRNVDQKTNGRFNQTEEWLDIAAGMLQEDKSSVDFEKFQNKLKYVESFIEIIKKKQTDKLKPKAVNQGFAVMQDYMELFERAWKKHKPEEEFPSPPIDSNLEGDDEFADLDLSDLDMSGDAAAIKDLEDINVEDDDFEIEDDEPSPILGQASIDSLKKLSKNKFVEDEILQLAKAWEDSLSDNPMEEERKLRRNRNRKIKGKKPQPLKNWQLKLKKTWEKGGEINDKNHVKLAMKMLKTPDEKLQKLLKKISIEKPSLFDAVYEKVKTAMNKKTAQQEQIERTLKPLIQKLMRGK